ncbi:MAG: hypothetical protein ACQ9MH_01440 [Nitrospinales bacterium]
MKRTTYIHKKFVQNLKLFSFALAFLIPISSQNIIAAEYPLQIVTTSKVSETGKVGITLTLKNITNKPLYNIQPIFHFHHSMHKMPPVQILKAGESYNEKTSDHPSVLRVGRYPIMTVVKYKPLEDEQAIRTQTHTDSFYFSEPVVSVIDGELTTHKQAEGHLLKIQLNNNSPSLKNIRVMLHLPPELMAKSFKGMMGFTMRPGEEKRFEIPVQKRPGNPGGDYPVHLMVEYAEMLKHYASVIPGEIHYSLGWNKGGKWPQLLVFIFLFGSIIWFLKNKSRETPEPV